MTLPNVVSREEWTAARKELLVREKELTRARDALNADRRRLPMVKIDKEYMFDGQEGKRTLPELFDSSRQLMIWHFMFDPSWEDGCPACSAAADERSDGLFAHLEARNTRFVCVARAPLDKIERYKAKKGWTFPWYSSYGSDFNYDFHVTLDGSVMPVEYNYKTADELAANAAARGYPQWEQPFELHGLSCFLRDGDDVFHTYSTYGRGTESLGGSYYYLDLTALGRQEDWEAPKGRATTTRGADPSFST